MPVSDALVVGEDWISEHYFTTDATKESFKKRVDDRRKAWDAEAAEEHETTRSRFVAARGDLERRLIALSVLTGDEDDTAPTDQAHTEATSDQIDSGPRPLTEEERDDVRALDDRLLAVLGYRTGEFTLRDDGPLTWVAPPAMPDNPPLVIVRARPVATTDDLIAKKVPTLLTPWVIGADDTPLVEEGAKRGGLRSERSERLETKSRNQPHELTSVSATLSHLMTAADGPTFALVLAGRWCLIAEKERWPEGRWLAVDLQLVCERNETKRGGEIDRALTCLDAASLAPDASGTTWWSETLEDSTRHTVGVSKDLREGVRLSIEVIANEVLKRRTALGLDPLPADQAQELARQALRYLYRILFLLYAEASPELGVLPVGAQEYDAGYGLDRLRDLALTEIHSERARTGTHLYESLDRLFVLVDRGHEPGGNEERPDGLTFHALRADLFRPDRIALIHETKLGNEALLKVLRKLLLSKESSKQQRGFISYVELGINQLGAVYEGLMSYTGSFATEDLYEVAKNGDPSKGSWVVPVTRAGHLDKADFVRVRNEETGEDEPVIHRKGTFVFRLSGRDRQRSASYYTPEVLTKFTVQQALEELLDQDDTRTSTADILNLTVCEPALGSGAFAIEAVRQLAEQYLTRRQEELGKSIDPEEYPAELQKVKAHIALHQVYGVDLNATAVELAEVSLWLDTMVKGLAAPWFGLRLRRGNSLVGARHAFYQPEDLAKKAWLTKTPEDRPLTTTPSVEEPAATPLVEEPATPLVEEPRASEASPGRLETNPAADAPTLTPVGRGATKERLETTPASLNGAIHHFLLPAQGWGSAVEVPKSVRDLVPPDTLKRLKTWRSSIRKAPTKTQIKQLQDLATRVERLWGIALRRLQIAEAESSRSIDIWNRPGEAPKPSTVSREAIEASLADPDGAWQRLHTLMDAWCGLWFWPLTEETIEPPSFNDWLDACRMILGTPEKAKASDWKRGDGSLFSSTAWDALNDEESNDRIFAQAAPMAEVREKHAWLSVCEQVADDQGFFHWELDFATVFARGGFDLQVGNPPWVRPNVELDPLLAEGDPWWALTEKADETKRAVRQTQTLTLPGIWHLAVHGACDQGVLANTLNAPTLFPLLTGRPDLYRAFVLVTWRNSSDQGCVGLIHMDSHLNDVSSSELRRESYRRLRRHWQFTNQLILFDIRDRNIFSVNVYGSVRAPGFLNAAFLYHPDTVVRSLVHDGSGPQPGLKTAGGAWDMAPHRSRIQTVNQETLNLWAAISGSEQSAAPPMIHAVNDVAMRTLRQLSQARRIASLDLLFSSGWNETTDKKKGIFIAKWGLADWSDAILQGPHLQPNTPLAKVPNPSGRNKNDWSATDLESVSCDAQPVTAYKTVEQRPVDDPTYTRWISMTGSPIPAASTCRVAWRTMMLPVNERSIFAAIIPPGSRHINAVTSAYTPDFGDLLRTAGVMSSLLCDFFVRAAPKDLYRSVVERFPMVPKDHWLSRRLALRVLRLNCVTDAYSELWAACWDKAFLDDEPILLRFDERPIGPEWTPDTPLRRAADRRNAQVEIDAMVAIMLGVPIEDLCTIYRTQFAVLYGYDHREYTFDANGRLVPNSVLSLWRKLGEPQDPSRMSEADRTATHPGSGIPYTYALPFTLFDRESNFRQVAACLTAQ